MRRYIYERTADPLETAIAAVNAARTLEDVTAALRQAYAPSEPEKSLYERLLAGDFNSMDRFTFLGVLDKILRAGEAKFSDLLTPAVEYLRVNEPSSGYNVHDDWRAAYGRAAEAGSLFG